jgi:hypothetical protein
MGISLLALDFVSGDYWQDLYAVKPYCAPVIVL